MASSFLKIELIGNLGRDPEMKYTPAGTPVTNFSVATTRIYTKGEEKVEETTWSRITTWGKLAENCNQYLKKGSKVYIEGRLIPDTNGGPRVYEKGDGSFGASFEINAEKVLFLSGREGGSASAEDGNSGETIPF